MNRLALIFKASIHVGGLAGMTNLNRSRSQAVVTSQPPFWKAFPMPTLRLVLGDQLSRSISSLADYAPGDMVLMAELAEEATYVRHHKKKIAFIFSAMRHFARELEEEGLEVAYVRLDDPGNTAGFTGEVERALASGAFDRLVVSEPGEWRVMEMFRDWQDRLAVPVEVREDDRFLASLGQFERWADGRKQLRMEYFYRQMRRQSGFLMRDGEPLGGHWNFDQENRQAAPKGMVFPQRPAFKPDCITQDVLALVEARFGDHFGDLHPFDMPVSRAEALVALHAFIAQCLPEFGRYQDAMVEGEPFLFHANLSAAMNAGLLLPREVCEAAQRAYDAGLVPLNAAEGFIRQILGWREYVRGLYWLKMPHYKSLNALGASRALPGFYWSGQTDMACMADAIATTRRHAYAHHIQRLMVTGNFALLAGIAPDAINDWYLLVYADAYEWVELPNTHGMAIFADGGIMASKPYAASGAYINRMSNHCARCRYKVKKKSGPDACPFNYLYWDFMIRNRDQLAGNQRLAMIYRSLERMGADQIKTIQRNAHDFLTSLEE